MIISTITNRDSGFWQPPPPLPAGLSAELRGTHVVERRGPGGATLVDEVDLRWAGGRADLLVAYRPRLAASELPRLKRLVAGLAEDLARRGGTHAPPALVIPAVATDVAPPALVDGAIGEGLAILDRVGTISVRAPGLLLHVQGAGRVHRASRARPFAGRGCRVVRWLLAWPQLPHTATEVAARTETSYAHAFNVLARLEELRLVHRETPRTGFRIRDPVGLLRAWIESGAATALVVKGFFAPSTTPDALRRAAVAWKEAGQRAVFTLASALLPDELHATGIPHGIYLPGDVRPVEEALQLRRITPHNFLVLRPEPAAQTEAGGILLSPRELPHGPGVAVPQLVVDLHRIGGRGKEQGEFLLRRWADALPKVEAP